MPTVHVPSGRPKRDIIEMAFEECGIAGYEFERTPEEVGAALRKLNALMLEWPWSKLGYEQPVYAQGEPDELSGLPDHATNAVALELAFRIAPNMGATLSPESRSARANARSLILAEVASVPIVKLGTVARGAGGRGSTFIQEV